MDDGKKTVLDYRAEYQERFSEVDDAYEYATSRSGELDGLILDAKERVRAFPNDRSEHESLIQLAMESRALWEECVKSLRAAAQDNDADRTTIARHINQSQDKTAEYKDLLFSATQSMLSNATPSQSQGESSFHKAGETLKSTGQAMQSAGNAMSSAGHKMSSAGHEMTMGITLPIIIAVVLFILLLMLL